VIRKAAARLPRRVRDALRRARRSYRSARYRVGARLWPLRLDADDVERALREVRVNEGDSVFMQSRMSAFGTFEDGPQTVLEGLRRAVGPEGLVAMAAFPLTGPAIEHLVREPVFDVRETPSRMGAISEAFRRAPGTVRSIHPTHSIVAAGPGAAELVAGHEATPTAFGEGTPFRRLIDRNALQVYFGSGTAPLTMYHAFECAREPPFPLDVFADRVFEVPCLDPAGEELTVRTLVHDPTLLPGRIDANPPLQRIFRRALLDAGGRSVRLGRGEILAIRLQPMMDMFERLLAEGITMYDADLPADQPDRPPQERVRVG
jgi:aminoglycoside 3-N-acetyltransferase